MLEYPGEGSVVGCKFVGAAGDELTRTDETLESRDFAVDGLIDLDFA